MLAGMIRGFNRFGIGVTVVITALTAIAVFEQITGIMFPLFDQMATPETCRYAYFVYPANWADLA